jgi:hypothetical protein
LGIVVIVWYDNVRNMYTIKAMDAASGELADLDGLSVAELKALLREQNAALQEKHAQLGFCRVWDALIERTRDRVPLDWAMDPKQSRDCASIA